MAAFLMISFVVFTNVNPLDLFFIILVMVQPKLHTNRSWQKVFSKALTLAKSTFRTVGQFYILIWI